MHRSGAARGRLRTGPATRSEIEPLEPVSTVGSGDAFLAGYVAARYEGLSPRECLAYGVACGAESTQHFGAGVLDSGEAKRLISAGRGPRLLDPAVASPDAGSARGPAVYRCYHRLGVGKPPAEPAFSGFQAPRSRGFFVRAHA